jgi:hypothetical protein
MKTVGFHTLIEVEGITPQQAALEAMCEFKRGELCAQVTDLSTNRRVV